MKKSHLLAVAALASLPGGILLAAPGLNLNQRGSGVIYNYATADALISGQPGSTVTPSTYNTSNTQDNLDAGGPFGLGVQLAGLPAGDNNDFAFVGTSAFAVAQTGNYVFSTNTDDGSRLRISINGGAFTQIINDDVLSGPHTAPSAPIALTAGQTINLDWMWFERAGGAEGESFYSRDGGLNALWQDGAQGLTLTGGNYSGTTYKAAVLAGPNNLAEADNITANGTNLGSAVAPTVNFGAGGRAGGESPMPGGGGDNFTLTADGYFNLSTAGTYTFFTNSDDGARLRIDGSDVVVDDFLQGPTDSAYVAVPLTAGWHSFEFTGFELGGGESFEAWVASGNFAAPKLSGVFNDAVFDLIGEASFPVYTVIPEPGAGLLALLGSVVALRRRKR